MPRNYTLHSLEDAQLCRALRDERLTYKQIAEKMEIHVSTVWHICNVSSDARRPGAPEVRKPRRDYAGTRPLEDALLCQELRKQGWTYQAIATRMNMSTSTVWRICSVTFNPDRRPTSAQLAEIAARKDGYL